MKEKDNTIPTVKELDHFLWQLDHAYAELNTFIDSNHSVSEIDRVDECNTFLEDALYENSNESEMTFPDKLRELFKLLAYTEQTNQK